MKHQFKLLRVTTVPVSLTLLLKGQPQFMMGEGVEVLTASADGPEVNQILEEGIPHQVIGLTRVISPFRDIIALVQMIKLILRFKPDVVHTHTPKAGLIGMMAARICRVPVRMHTVAGMPLMEKTGVTRRILVVTEWITYSCAQAVYFNSRGLEQFAKTLIPRFSGKFEVLGNGSSNGIDTAHFKITPEIRVRAEIFRKELEIDPTSRVFCFIGRLVGDKGINELVAAFDKLSRSENVTLILVGEQEKELDPLSDTTLHIIDRNARIRLAGFMRDVRVPLAASDFFVFPSYREGFPNVVMQAMAMEVHCIVSNINGCNELIDHGETGVIVPVKDSIALEAAMESVLSDPHCGPRTLKARENLVHYYDQGTVWRILLEEYRRRIMAKR